MKSSIDRPEHPAFYTLRRAPEGGSEGAAETFVPHPSTAGPWDPGAQHGGPPAALLGRALEGLAQDRPRVLGRFTMDLLGPVPVSPVTVSASVVRPGRSVSLAVAELYDEDAGRVAARAHAWLFPATETGPAPEPVPLPHHPEDGADKDLPSSWLRGYLDSVEWRWIEGAVTDPGPAVVWMRPLLPIVEGEQPSGLERLLCCIDSASGVSAALDPAEWGFLNTELTVHVLRPPVGDWICLEAETTLGPGSVGMAVSTAYDRHGLVARSAQALLVVKR